MSQPDQILDFSFTFSPFHPNFLYLFDFKRFFYGFYRVNKGEKRVKG